METESHVVIESAVPHRLKRLFHHLHRLALTCSLPIAEQKRKAVRGRELRSAPEPSVHIIEEADELFVRCLNR